MRSTAPEEKVPRFQSVWSYHTSSRYKRCDLESSSQTRTRGGAYSRDIKYITAILSLWECGQPNHYWGFFEDHRCRVVAHRATEIVKTLAEL